MTLAKGLGGNPGRWLTGAEADAEWARGLSDNQLRDAIIDNAAKIRDNDGRLTSHSSFDLDFALDLFDAALTEYAYRHRNDEDDRVSDAGVPL